MHSLQMFRVAGLLVDELGGALAVRGQLNAAALWQSREHFVVRLEEVRIVGDVQLHSDRTAARELTVQTVQVIVGFALSFVVNLGQLSSIITAIIVTGINAENQDIAAQEEEKRTIDKQEVALRNEICPTGHQSVRTGKT